jgi:hypothetical protein
LTVGVTPPRVSGGDGADAGLYEALNDAYDGALEFNGVISNVNTLALEEMSDAVAHAVLLYAMSTSSVSGTGQAPPSKGRAVATGEPYATVEPVCRRRRASSGAWCADGERRSKRPSAQPPRLDAR